MNHSHGARCYTVCGNVLKTVKIKDFHGASTARRCRKNNITVKPVAVWSVLQLLLRRSWSPGLHIFSST